jgi:hypothetical protein
MMDQPLWIVTPIMTVSGSHALLSSLAVIVQLNQTVVTTLLRAVREESGLSAPRLTTASQCTNVLAFSTLIRVASSAKKKRQIVMNQPKNVLMGLFWYLIPKTSASFRPARAVILLSSPCAMEKDKLLAVGTENGHAPPSMKVKHSISAAVVTNYYGLLSWV